MRRKQKQFVVVVDLKGCIEHQYYVKGLFLNCESCTAILVDSKNKNTELGMSKIGPSLDIVWH